MYARIRKLLTQGPSHDLTRNVGCAKLRCTLTKHGQVNDDIRRIS